MSILIKGMEMPKNCAECFFHKVFPATGVGINQLYCALCGINIVKLSDAQPDCPLIPVPPHGRLIDADALIARYEAQRTEDRDILCDERAFPSDYEKAQYRYSRNSDFISALKSQAAIIPAEEGE